MAHRAQRNMAAVGELTTQLPERLDFVPPERMRRRLAVLGAADMQGASPVGY